MSPFGLFGAFHDTCSEVSDSDSVSGGCKPSGARGKHKQLDLTRIPSFGAHMVHNHQSDAL